MCFFLWGSVVLTAAARGCGSKKNKKKHIYIYTLAYIYIHTSLLYVYLWYIHIIWHVLLGYPSAYPGCNGGSKIVTAQDIPNILGFVILKAWMPPNPKTSHEMSASKWPKKVRKKNILDGTGLWYRNIKSVMTYNYWVAVSNIFYFHPYLGKWSNLTSRFFNRVETTNEYTTHRQYMGYFFFDSHMVWLMCFLQGISVSKWTVEEVEELERGGSLAWREMIFGHGHSDPLRLVVTSEMKTKPEVLEFFCCWKY